MPEGIQPQTRQRQTLSSRFTALVRAAERIPPVYGIIFVIALSAALFIVTTIFRSFIEGLGNWGYLAAFFVAWISAATIVLPAPGLAALLVLAQDFNFFWLGVAAGLGGTLGEPVAYWLGLHGGKTIEGKRFHDFLCRNMNRYGGGVLIAFSLIPFLPIDAAGIFAGASRYPFLKFMMYVAIGKTILMIGVMYAVAESIEWAQPWFERIL